MTHSVRHMLASCLMRILHMRYTRMKNATVWTHSVDHDRNLCGSGQGTGGHQRARQPGAEKEHALQNAAVFFIDVTAWLVELTHMTGLAVW